MFLNPLLKEEEMSDEKGKKEILFYLELKKELLQCALGSAGDYFRELIKHPDWPEDPENYYADEWEDWNTFLGFLKNSNSRNLYFSSFENLKKGVIASGITSIPDYIKACKKNTSWPFNPENVYHEWISWKDFFKKREIVITRKKSND